MKKACYATVPVQRTAALVGEVPAVGEAPQPASTRAGRRAAALRRADRTKPPFICLPQFYSVVQPPNARSAGRRQDLGTLRSAATMLVKVAWLTLVPVAV
jgi:hypothetical protein